MSNLVDHAERELRAAGLLDEGSDYGGMVGAAVMKAVRSWAEEGHSGASHALALSLFTRVVDFKPLGPLTNSPDEWMEIDSGKLWQSTRDSEAFSEDGGVTFYRLSEKLGHYDLRHTSVTRN